MEITGERRQKHKSTMSSLQTLKALKRRAGRGGQGTSENETHCSKVLKVTAKRARGMPAGEMSIQETGV